jgi:hypothetical protein
VKLNKLIIVFGLIFLGLTAFIGAYSYWNNADPQRTCASCHEIRNSVESFSMSAHRDFSCTECHGSAFSNGIHSLKEKSGMLFTHLGGKVLEDEIHMTEEQILSTSAKCINCHQSEHKKWLAGGHSANYNDIFLDTIHNKMEAPYPDCFRCHGMFYEGSVETLVSPLNNQGPWEMIDKDQGSKAAIPCLSCHQTHTENRPWSVTLVDSLGYMPRNPIASLYMRADKMHLRADHLLIPEIFKNGKSIKQSPDPVQRLCIQCHSPNYQHISGTEDDKTSSGIHQGISCRACHEMHSNDTRKACNQCHPAISNCKLDVKTMNTSYRDNDSPNDIHHMTCGSCHNDSRSGKLSRD